MRNNIVTLDREQCIGLVEIISKADIDFFEMRFGCVELIFHRREMAGFVDGNNRYESGAFAVEVLSPMLGICRIAPSVGALPYVQVGQKVSEQDIICSIDVLEKKFDVPAGANGIIVQLYTRSDELIEYKQQLAIIQTIK
jgi:biotin carboxyl carrier protein